MKRRLILATALVAALGGGLASTASASTATTRHKLCIDHQQLLPNGFCVVWDDPTPVAPQQ